MLDLTARNVSASVHTLTGSSLPGTVLPFTPVATRHAADAELIDLARRVKALAKRDHRAWDRVAAIEDAIGAARKTLPAVPDNEAAKAERDRREQDMGERLGLTRWQKLSRRTFARLVRWSEQLTAMEPHSQAGLAAKAAALLAIQETGNLDGWVTDLALAVSRDAVRVATALAAEADSDEQLLHLVDAWRDSARRVDEGAKTLDAQHEAACEENRALRLQILRLPAHTIDGIRAKAEVALWTAGDVEAMRFDRDRLILENDATSEAFAAGLMLDVVRVLGTSPAPRMPEAGDHAAALSSDHSEPRYPASVSPEMVESYRIFLEMELRFLNAEIYGQVKGRLPLWHCHPAGSFHGGAEPPASSRAEAVLSLFGLLPTGKLPITFQDAASAA